MDYDYEIEPIEEIGEITPVKIKNIKCKILGIKISLEFEW